MHIHVCNHPEVDTVVFKETTNRFYLSDDFLDISIFYLLQNDHIIIYIHLFIYLFIYFSVWVHCCKLAYKPQQLDRCNLQKL